MPTLCGTIAPPPTCVSPCLPCSRACFVYLQPHLPQFWPNVRFPRDWQILHLNTSPSTPFLIPEFQGGSGTGWGPNSVNQDACAALVGPSAIRVLYKNNWSFGAKLVNVYMTYGGTNWGNLGYEGGDSSYDYGAAVDEGRGVVREKYSEEKMQAYFLKVRGSGCSCGWGWNSRTAPGQPSVPHRHPRRGAQRLGSVHPRAHAHPGPQS